MAHACFSVLEPETGLVAEVAGPKFLGQCRFSGLKSDLALS